MTADKKSVFDLYRRGVELLDAGDPAQAALVLEKAYSIEPEKASICEALGRAYFNYSQFNQAGIFFKRALKIDPSNHYGHFGIALCLEKLGYYQKALGHIKLAVAMAPKNDEYRKAKKMIEKATGG